MEQQKVSYYNEISMMMFGFGDSHKPNPETVRLVESIVLSQLRLIVREALKYSKNDTLKPEELIFLMRKNKFKMRRFVKYLHNQELKKRIESNVVDLTNIPKNSLIEFIERIDETGELTDLSEFDEVKHERQVRADRISRALDEEKYKKFSKARCASFNSRQLPQLRNFEKMRSWIDPKKIIITAGACEVLAYYAYETVAQITDYALLVRLDNRRTNDPLSNLCGTYYTGSMFNGEHRFSGINPDYSTVYSGQPPISVNEIREVMRRLTKPEAGRLNFGTSVPPSQHILAI